MAHGLSWLPIITAVVLLAAMLITYIIGVALGHVHHLFPYISDAGADYPESSIFSFLFDVVAFLILLNVYVQFLMHRSYYNQMQQKSALSLKSLRIANVTCLILAVIASAGMAVLANFPVDEKILVHLLGAFSCFTASLIYCFLQSWVSYRLSPELVPPWLSLFRLLLSVFSTAAYVILIICGTVLRWDATTENPKLRYRRISAGCEWFLAVALIVYFLTYIHEFRRIDIKIRLLHWNTESKTWDPEVTEDLLERLTNDSQKESRSTSGGNQSHGKFSKKVKWQKAKSEEVI